MRTHLLLQQSSVATKYVPLFTAKNVNNDDNDKNNDNNGNNGIY